MHKRCKGEGKSYTIFCSKKTDCQTGKSNPQPAALEGGSNSGYQYRCGLYSYHYTNGLLLESKIQTVYNRNTRRRTIKVYAGIVMLAFCISAQAKCERKTSATSTPGIEHTPSHARGVRVSAVPIAACEMSVDVVKKYPDST